MRLAPPARVAGRAAGEALPRVGSVLSPPVRARLNNAIGEGDFGQRWEFAPPSSCAPSTSIWEVAPSLVSSSDDGVKRASRPWWAAGGVAAWENGTNKRTNRFFPLISGSGG
jgi:hypothetical protein